MKKQLDRLLIINQVMQPNHPALSHQIDVVNKLSSHFASIQVLTGLQASELPMNLANICIRSYRLKNGSRLMNSLSFYFQFFRILTGFRPQAIFCHMATTESLLISPITRLLRIRHLLWYAHKSQPWQLRLTSKLVNYIVTSTNGSCPVSGPKVKYIGQGIEVGSFYAKRLDYSSLQKLVYVGRLDAAKGIHLILAVVERLANILGPLDFELVGSPMRFESQRYLDEIEKNMSRNQLLKITITDAIPRHRLRECCQSKDLFIHAYEGSLDKVLIEATLADLPVITLNNEFNKHFSSPMLLSNGSLLDRVIAWQNMKPEEKRITMQARREIAQTKHSLENWAYELSQLLNSDHE